MSEIRTSRIPAKARNPRLRYGGNAYFSGGTVASTGGSASSFWRLATSDDLGNVYESPFIRTVYDTVIEKTNGFSQIGKMRFTEQRDNNSLFMNQSDGTAASLLVSGDVVAYATSDWDISAPIASADLLGMIKIGDGLSITADGVLSATGGGSGGTGGLGSLIVTGSGNAVTSAALSNDNTTLTLTKGYTFAYSSGTNASGTWGISISGNAATATRMQTARTLWGQSFDGTNSVSGTLTGVGHIYPAVSGSYNIGTTSNRFNYGYFSSIRAMFSASETSSATQVNPGSIELYNSTPFIDFHYNNSAADYTSRIIEQASGTLTCSGNWRAGGYVLAGGDVVAYSTGSYNLSSPVASSANLGMIKVGSGLSITNGVLSATGGGTGGGGISSVTVGGTGNAVTTASISGSVLTLTRGSTFALNSDLTTHTANTTIHITSAERTTWNGKQNKLTAGTGISISGNTISATGGGTGGSGAIGSVQYYAGTTTAISTTYTSGINIRCGYFSLSGTLAAGSYTTIILNNVPVANGLSVTANVVNYNGANTGVGLTCTISSGTGGSGNYYVTVYNASGASVSLTGLRVNYTAIYRV